MKNMLSIKKLSLAACLAVTGVQAAQAASLSLQVVHFNKVGSTLQFELYMGSGTGYPNSNTTRGFKSSNIRFELKGVGGGTIDVTGATVTDINTAYVDLVTVTPAPGADQYAGTTDRFSVQVARNMGMPLQSDLPATPVRIATITLPIANGTFTDRQTTLTARIATFGSGSFWNDLTNSSQTFGQLNSPAPLPVALLGFDAEKSGESRVTLSWKTANEQQSDYFEVERSAEGRLFTTTIDHIVAAGNSMISHNYLTYDLHPLTGFNYYRLKMVGKDGERSYSGIRQVYFDGKAGAIAIYPTNNTDGVVYADLLEGYEQASLTLLNLLGQVMTPAFTGTGLHRTISLNGLAPGQYLVNVSLQGRSQSFKVNYRP